MLKANVSRWFVFIATAAWMLAVVGQGWADENYITDVHPEHQSVVELNQLVDVSAEATPPVVQHHETFIRQKLTVNWSHLSGTPGDTHSAVVVMPRDFPEPFSAVEEDVLMSVEEWWYQANAKLEWQPAIADPIEGQWFGGGTSPPWYRSWMWDVSQDP